MFQEYFDLYGTKVIVGSLLVYLIAFGSYYALGYCTWDKHFRTHLTACAYMAEGKFTRAMDIVQSSRDGTYYLMALARIIARLSLFIFVVSALYALYCRFFA